MMEEYAEIDLIKTRRLQVEVRILHARKFYIYTSRASTLKYQGSQSFRVDFSEVSSNHPKLHTNQCYKGEIFTKDVWRM